MRFRSWGCDGDTGNVVGEWRFWNIVFLRMVASHDSVEVLLFRGQEESLAMLGVAVSFVLCTVVGVVTFCVNVWEIMGKHRPFLVNK
jgi:hypothetical protein